MAASARPQHMKLLLMASRCMFLIIVCRIFHGMNTPWKKRDTFVVGYRQQTPMPRNYSSVLGFLLASSSSSSSSSRPRLFEPPSSSSSSSSSSPSSPSSISSSSSSSLGSKFWSTSLASSWMSMFMRFS